MPRGDGTGPWGDGPMTGRSAGYCAGFNQPGFASGGRGARFGGRGMRSGRGFNRGFWGRSVPAWNAPAASAAPVYSAPTPETEVHYLKAEKAQLEQELKNLSARIDALSKEKSE